MPWCDCSKMSEVLAGAHLKCLLNLVWQILCSQILSQKTPRDQPSSKPTWLGFFLPHPASTRSRVIPGTPLMVSRDSLGTSLGIFGIFGGSGVPWLWAPENPTSTQVSLVQKNRLLSTLVEENGQDQETWSREQRLGESFIESYLQVQQVFKKYTVFKVSAPVSYPL